MARNDGVDRTVARNRDLKTGGDIHGAQAHNERQKESYVDLLDDARDLMRVKRALGSEKIDAVIALERDRDASREAEHTELERQRILARKRSGREDR